MMKFRKWTCKKCGRTYKTPAEHVVRILLLVPEWDYCPYDGTRREDSDGRA